MEDSKSLPHRPVAAMQSAGTPEKTALIWLQAK